VILQQVHLQVPLGRPFGAGDVAQAGGGQIQRRLPVGERANDARAPADLAQDALQRIVGSDPPPVLLGESVVAERLRDRRLDELRGPCEPLVAQLGGHLPTFS